MTAVQPRLRMFAGPNGSGKTTIKQNLGRPSSWLGIYINPDDLEQSLRETGNVSLTEFGLNFETRHLRDFFASSKFLKSRGLDGAASSIEIASGKLTFQNIEVNSYHISVLADFLRRKAIEASQSFSFETVMSHRDKVELLKQAQQSGFRTYLYYVATEAPEINIGRVNLRVAQGGHDVPEDKIVSRYHRSLALLPQATRFANRAYFFDTSGEEPWYIAETTDGKIIKPQSNELPNWFKPVWDMFTEIDN